MKVYMFPGQGSQKKGMGKELFEEFDEYAQIADEILGFSVKELCLNDKESRLSQTKYTQPALYVVNALSYFKYKQLNSEPDYFVGHSLGEYNALLAADAFSFETGLKIVSKRGELMSSIKEGGMAAVIGLSQTDVQKILNNHILNLEIANLNTPSQIVIAGPNQEIERAKEIFQKAGVKLFMPLNVSGPFHSNYMRDIQESYENYINQFLFNEPKTPVLSNVDALPYNKKNIRTNLIKQLVEPVQWDRTIQTLINYGITDFYEIGTGNVLTGLVSKIKSEKPKDYISEKYFEEPPSSDEKRNDDYLSVGDEEFCKDYGVRFPYIIGSMRRGISSPEFVAKLADNEFLSFLGTSSLESSEIDKIIEDTKHRTNNKELIGCNFEADLQNPNKEEEKIDLLLKRNIRVIEATSFLGISPSLIKYRARGLSKTNNGKIHVNNKIIIKLSRIETAAEFLKGPQKSMIDSMVDKGQITSIEASLLQKVSLIDDICVIGDSGGETSQENLNLLLPEIIQLRNEHEKENLSTKRIRVGAGGGIGTPNTAAIPFLLGADFILTGSINQCTVESGTSNLVKQMLQKVDLHDFSYVPKINKLGIKEHIQVVKRGVFFPARAEKLYDLLKKYNSISEIGFQTKEMIEDKYLNISMQGILQNKQQQMDNNIHLQKNNIKVIFNFYLNDTFQQAINGNDDQKVNFNIYCGPALAAFNRWVKGSELEKWENRNVDIVAEKIMKETIKIIEELR